MRSFFALAIAVLIASAAPSDRASAQSVCPDNFSAFAGTADNLSCACTAEATQIGSVWGMDVYTGDSGICRSAVHAGVIGRQGGSVTVIPEPGRNAYPGVTRNGISSSNYGRYESSFRFAGAPAATPGPAPAAAAPAARAAVSVCPDDFIAFAGTSEALTCTCSTEAAANGSVWGMDVYTGDSGICRSAVHAGVIGRQGGSVTVIPEPGRNAYPGVTRNGISSSNYGRYESSFRFAPPAVPVVNGTVPVQQPIASTLRQTGEAQLYIRFRFNSAEIEPDAAPVLEELLATLRGDPSLRLALIGHTDAVGSPEANLTLSARRAGAVGTWLIGRQIAPERLRVEGRGLTQPIADNATEMGRAINRRVQIRRVQ